MTKGLYNASPSGVSTPSSVGTPLTLPPERSVEALETLEFEAVLELVASHAAGPLGAHSVRSRRPTADLPWILHELSRVSEIRALLLQDAEIGGEPVPDVGRSLARLRIEGSVLEGAELAALNLVFRSARLTAGTLRRIEKDAPRSAELLQPVPDRSVETRLELAVDAEGRVLDTASHRLAVARREVQAARTRLIQKLEAILRALDPHSAASEGVVTMREGRYVIPIRRDSRSRPAGIIHGESASRGTLFMEPTEAIELGNALRAAEAEEAFEELQVLRDLTELLRPEAETIAAAHAMVVAVDDLIARAKYAVATDGHAPIVRSSPAALTVRHGRHPLLLTSSDQVVPFDLELADGEHTVLISGPNTGGKTVLLKAVGLMAAMAQSGIVPTVSPGTSLPVFERFFADIGDHQSIAASLSTFSAHAKLLSRVLREADDASLVLLDEIGSGTDPSEGAALAAAVLLALTRRQALTLASTHLGALKTLPARSAGIVNASLQFDAQTLQPTYRFRKGVPGRSYGLAIARGLGIPGDVLTEAEMEVPEAQKHLDTVLAAVERREREQIQRDAELTGRERELESLAARLAGQQREQAAREVELSQREKTAERETRRQARAYLLESRQRVEEAIELARRAADESSAREARRLVEQGVQAEAEALAEGEGGSADGRMGGEVEGLTIGSRVRTSGGVIGTVVEVRADEKLVLAVGAMRTVVEPNSVVSVEKRVPPPIRPSVHPSDAPKAVDPAPVLELDVRGLTGDEAEAATLAAVDAAIVAEQPFLRIIHGKGTGVVRDRVQRLVKSDRRVKKSDFAPARQGGTGVTIVELSR